MRYTGKEITIMRFYPDTILYYYSTSGNQCQVLIFIFIFYLFVELLRKKPVFKLPQILRKVNVIVMRILKTLDLLPDSLQLLTAVSLYAVNVRRAVNAPLSNICTLSRFAVKSVSVVFL